MKFELPFAYSVVGRTARATYPKKVVMIGFEEVDIPEISGYEAPVALEWDKTEIDGTPTVRRHVRSFDGRFFAPIEVVEWSTRLPMPASDLPKRNHRPDPRFGLDLARHTWPQDEQELMIALKGWYEGNDEATTTDVQKIEVSSSSEEERRAQARGLADNLIVVEGEVYVAVPEPRLCIAVWRLPFPGASATVVTEDVSYVGDIQTPKVASPAAKRFFRVSDMASFEAEIEQLGGDAVMNDIAYVRVANEAVFEFDRSFDAAVRTAVFAHQRLEGCLSTLGRSVANAWYDLDDAIAAYKGGGDRYSFEDQTVAALSSMAPFLERDMPELAEELRMSIEIWASSTIELNIASPGSAPGSIR